MNPDYRPSQSTVVALHYAKEHLRSLLDPATEAVYVHFCHARKLINPASTDPDPERYLSLFNIALRDLRSEFVGHPIDFSTVLTRSVLILEDMAPQTRDQARQKYAGVDYDVLVTRLGDIGSAPQVQDALTTSGQGKGTHMYSPREALILSLQTIQFHPRMSSLQRLF